MHPALPMTMADRMTPWPPNPESGFQLDFAFACLSFDVTVTQALDHLVVHQVAIVAALAVDELAHHDFAATC